jgi:transposase
MSDPFPQRFTRAKAKKAYQACESFTDRDGEWFSLRKASAYIGLNKSTLLKWKKRCPWLGRGIARRRFREPTGRRVHYLLKADLDQAMAAHDASTTRSTNDEKWIPIKDAAVIYPWSLSRLYYFVSIGKLRGKRVIEAHEQANHRRVLLLRKKALGKLEAKLEKNLDQKGLSRREVAEELGVSKSTVRSWQRHGVLHADKGSVVGPDNRMIRNGWRSAKTKVEKIKRIRARPIDLPHEDAEGTWLTESLATKRYPNAQRFTLQKYRNEPCPGLGGNVLRAKQVPRPERKGGRWPKHWAYLEACLKDLKRLEPGAHRLSPLPDGIAQEDVLNLPPAGEVNPARQKRGRGRPKGTVDQNARDRDAKIKDAWRANPGLTGTDLAQQFGVDRSYAYKIIRLERSGK